MFFTICSHGPHALDLGSLLHKKLTELYTYNLGHGEALHFFPHWSCNCCQSCLLLEVKPAIYNVLTKIKHIRLPYANPRQALSFSLIGNAISTIYASTLEDDVNSPVIAVSRRHDLTIKLSNFSCDLNPDCLDRIFTPLGYEINWEKLRANAYKLEFGELCGELHLRCHMPVQSMLAQLYILLPIFDKKLHHLFTENTLEKFIRYSKPWLDSHPAKRLIIEEYFSEEEDMREAMKHFHVQPVAIKKTGRKADTNYADCP